MEKYKSNWKRIRQKFDTQLILKEKCLKTKLKLCDGKISINSTSKIKNQRKDPENLNYCIPETVL